MGVRSAKGRPTAGCSPTAPPVAARPSGIATRPGSNQNQRRRCSRAYQSPSPGRAGGGRKHPSVTAWQLASSGLEQLDGDPGQWPGGPRFVPAGGSESRASAAAGLKVPSDWVGMRWTISTEADGNPVVNVGDDGVTKVLQALSPTVITVSHDLVGSCAGRFRAAPWAAGRRLVNSAACRR